MQTTDSTQQESDAPWNSCSPLKSKIDLSPLDGKTVLISGAWGLIGRNLWGTLVDRTSCNVVRLERPLMRSLREFPQPIADYIVHAAGYGQPAKFLADPFGTITLATEALVRLRYLLNPGGTLVFMSSSEVYSGSTRIPHAEDDIGTSSPAHPRAVYIEAKRCGEAVVHAMRREGTRAIALRACLVYGAGVKWDDDRLLNQLIRRGLTEGNVSLRDFGNAVRSYCYAGDAVDQVINIMLHGKHAVYNVGNDRAPVSVWELARLIAQSLGVDARRPADVDYQAADGAPLNVMVSMQRYREEFGDQAFTSLRDGLLATIAWHRAISEPGRGA